MGCQASKAEFDPELLAPIESVSRGQMQGLWHVALTTFPMWTKGDKLRPTISYNIPDQSKDLKMEDHIEYEIIKGHDQSRSSSDNGHEDKRPNLNLADPNLETEKKSLGFKDQRDKRCPAHFTSKKGILKKNEFYIVYANHEKGVAAIAFSKEGSTGDGIDILVRDPDPAAMQMCADAIVEAKAALRKLDRFRPLVAELQAPAGFPLMPKANVDPLSGLAHQLHQPQGQQLGEGQQQPGGLVAPQQQQVPLAAGHGDNLSQKPVMAS